MSATFTEANDDILTLFKAAWDPTTWEVVYENIGTPGSPPDTPSPWARPTVRHNPGEPASLGDATGQKRYNRTGLLTVGVFVPIGEGLSRAYDLAKIVADAYEGKASPRRVWFRNVRVLEVGPDGEWFQVNVLIDFTYVEVK